MAPLRYTSKFVPILTLDFAHSPAVQHGTIQGKEGITFCHLATLYRERKLPFDECWARSKKVVLLHNLMTFLGNVAIAAALLICHGFDLTEIILIVAPTVANPFLLLGMGYLYFWGVHPWRMLLKSEL